MTFGYGGFFGLDEEEYRKKLRKASTEDPKKQEIAKTRRQVSCGLTVGSGVGWAVFTFGASLAFSAIGGRKWRVANRKLKMIQEELQRRQEKLHKTDWKDVCIPGTAFLVGNAVGVGLDFGIDGVYGTVNPTPADGLQDMISQPQEAVQDFYGGVISETNHIVVSDGTHIADPGTGSTAHNLGANTAQDLVTAAANLAVQQTTWCIAEYLEHPERDREASRTL
ncbi:hypothetical protein DIS24_g8792 [Lasiodiplodia hormozganensis]|uniref:Uncharacterized protein n=1 Tax=Lasiodiplodia hormozganensis TaxID=869390 RepID=A0AA39XYK2_9PEZI|nr:hypothetical protein DIS24_g8792 [Lasiodiplodia hormozganensis]